MLPIYFIAVSMWSHFILMSQKESKHENLYI
jgi:hypothetical protein